MQSKAPIPLPNHRAVLGHNQPPPSLIAKRLDGIARAVDQYADLHNDGLRLCVVEATSIALEIRQGGPAAWRAFINESRWGDKAPPTKGFEKSLLHVFRWIFGVDGAAAKNASFYSRAVQTLLDEGAEISELEEHLKQRTFKELAAAQAASKRKRRELTNDQLKGSKKHRVGSKARKVKKTKSDIRTDKAVAAKNQRYEGSVSVELVGNTQPFLGLQKDRLFILRGRIVTIGEVSAIAVEDIILDPDARD